MRRETDNDRLPPQALAVIVVVAIADLNFLRTARPIVQAAGQDAWLSILISFIGTGFSVWLIYAVMRQFPHKTLVEIAQTVFGRPLGIVLVVFYVSVWLLRASTLLQLQSYLFTRQLLPSTPEVVLSLYMLFLSSYLVRHGLEPMARLFVLIFAAYLLPLIPVAVLGVEGMEFGRLKPFLDEGMMPVLNGAWMAYGATPGPEILLMITPLLTRLRGALPAALSGVALIMVPALALTVLLVTQFGAPGVAELVWPTLSLVEIIEVPSFSGLRLDPLFLVVWSLLIFGSVAFNQFAATAALRHLFQSKTNQWPLTMSTGILFAFLFVPINPLELTQWVETTAFYLTPITTMLFPGLFFVTAHVRGVVQSDERGSRR